MSTPQEFARTLFASPPSGPHSVQLEFDTGGDVPALFEVLLLVFTEGMKTMYAPPIHFSSITEESLAKTVAYFASFGIKLTVTITDLPPVLHIKNSRYLRQTRLEEMTFQASEAEKLYTVQFNFLPK
jgi:hypothetical protein